VALRDACQRRFSNGPPTFFSGPFHSKIHMILVPTFGFGRNLLPFNFFVCPPPTCVVTFRPPPPDSVLCGLLERPGPIFGSQNIAVVFFFLSKLHHHLFFHFFPLGGLKAPSPRGRNSKEYFSVVNLGPPTPHPQIMFQSGPFTLGSNSFAKTFFPTPRDLRKTIFSIFTSALGPGMSFSPFFPPHSGGVCLGVIQSFKNANAFSATETTSAGPASLGS